MQKQPLSTAITREKIMNAFFELYKTTNIGKITISSITKSAGVHRSTFYEYFKDIYDVLEQLENDFLESVNNEIINIVDSYNPTDINTYINLILSFFTEHVDFIYYLLGPNGDPAFREKIYQIVKHNFIKLNHLPADYPYNDYLSSLAFSIMMNNLNYWFEHKEETTIQEIIELTYKFIGNGFLNFKVE